MRNKILIQFYILILILNSCVTKKDNKIIISKDFVENYKCLEGSVIINPAIVLDLNEHCDTILKIDNFVKYGCVSEDKRENEYYKIVGTFNTRKYSRKIYYNDSTVWIWEKYQFKLDQPDYMYSEKIKNFISLEKNRWYIITGLECDKSIEGSWYYVYVDSLGKTHQFERKHLSNY